MALLRAKAHVHRDAATVMDVEQKSVMTRTRNVKPSPPPGESMTTPKMYGRACWTGAFRMSSRGGIVAQMGTIKNSPAMPPTGTHRDMALGSFVVGSPHSSAMNMIMPMAENLAGCQREFDAPPRWKGSGRVRLMVDLRVCCGENPDEERKASPS